MTLVKNKSKKKGSTSMRYLIKSQRILLTVILVSTSIFYSCSINDNPVDSGQSSNYSTIEGRLSGNSGFNKLAKISSTEGIEGATVTVARVNANGSLTTVSNGSVQTDTQGKFVIQSNANTENNLMVICTKGSSEWKAIVSGSVNRGSKTYCPPVNEETTEEAVIYSEVQSQGKSNLISYADIRMFINAEIAAKVKTDQTLRAKIISSLESSGSARIQFLSSSSVGATTTQMQAIASANVQAQSEIDSYLYLHDDSQLSYDAANEQYSTTLVGVYISSGLKAESCAKTIELSLKALVKASTGVNSDSRDSFERSCARIKAYFFAKVNEEQFRSTGASQSQISAVVTAGVNLKTSIKVATTLSQMNNAFIAYHNSLVTQFKTYLSVRAQTIDSIEASINNVAGVKATLNSSLSLAISSQMVVNAYIEFFNAVKLLVQSSMGTATQAEINNTTEILVLANICS